MSSSSSSSSRLLRSSISPFRFRKSLPAPPIPPPTRLSTTTSSTTSLSTVPSPSSFPMSSTTTLSTTSQNIDNPSPPPPPPDLNKAKENVTVTVRFRPLNNREISKGDEIAWYADGDYTVRNEHHSSIQYSFDRVFGPATTTRQVYDVAAQHVVAGTMKGINGTVFAYGVTSSGKTHTMHGEQKSPGIIPLSVKDVFGIIQETPGREFLLRVSYLEIYNEVINDLLNPTGQNLRIREDDQGIYVEGIKEEVVLSPAHALSLIATGEEHRHVGSNNFNLMSSRSHTIFTLTIESSPRGDDQAENVSLSQLHLIDLAGSESSKTGTSGLRRKEGSFINKSLLTLGTVISKLTDGKASHIPYRDSKLTRLLQSSLSGNGRVSLICTVTPASSNSEETHNTLKFAHRSKHVEIKASANKIMDERSLIKKYQKEISSLKQELLQLKCGIVENQNKTAPSQEDLVNLKLQLEAGQVKLQSRLEEEEQAKEALLGRIQRLTKLILVSTKNTVQPVHEKLSLRRRHSFGEDVLANLPDRNQENAVYDDDAGSHDSGVYADGRADTTNMYELEDDCKRTRKQSMLRWLKLKKPEVSVGLSSTNDLEISASGSPSSSSKSSQLGGAFSDVKDGKRRSISRKVHDTTRSNSSAERTQAGDLFSATFGIQRLPPSGNTITDQTDLLNEQVKMLAGEVALCTSSLKRLREQSIKNSDQPELQERMQNLKEEIREKKTQMHMLEQRMIGSVEIIQRTSNNLELSQAFSKLATQLNEKTFELEIKSADNRVLQEQLQNKINEISGMQETIFLLRQQIDSLSSAKSCAGQQIPVDDNILCRCQSKGYPVAKGERNNCLSFEEKIAEEKSSDMLISVNEMPICWASEEFSRDAFHNSQLSILAAEIESLKQQKMQITEEKGSLKVENQKLYEEATYAKELATAAAVELRNLAAEVTKLSYQNAMLAADLASTKEASSKAIFSHRSLAVCLNQTISNSARSDAHFQQQYDHLTVEELHQELSARYKREASLVAALSERDKLEGELRKKLDEAKRYEETLEKELADMWALVAKIRRSSVSKDGSVEEEPLDVLCTRTGNGNPIPVSDEKARYDGQCEDTEVVSSIEELNSLYNGERKRCKELEGLLSKLKGGDNLLHISSTLEELQYLHVEAISNICHARCQHTNHIL